MGGCFSTLMDLDLKTATAEQLWSLLTNISAEITYRLYCEDGIQTDSELTQRTQEAVTELYERFGHEWCWSAIEDRFRKEHLLLWLYCKDKRDNVCVLLGTEQDARHVKAIQVQQGVKQNLQ